MTTTGPSAVPPGGERSRPRIVVGIDGSPGCRVAMRTALLEAAARGAGVEAVSVYLVILGWTAGKPVDVPNLDALRADTRDGARALVAEVREEMLAQDIAEIGDVPVRVVIDGGQAAPILVKRSAGAELLVVGSRGQSTVRSLLLGSVALHCVTHAPCPVVVAHGRPGGAQDRGRRVAVGLDGSDGALDALREAVGQALRRRAELDVLVAYTVDPYAFLRAETLRARVEEEAQRLVDGVTAEFTGSGVAVPAVHVHVVDGSAREILVDRSEDAAMLVVGSRGRGAFRGLLLGSVALHCAMHARCPVTVVPPLGSAVPLEEPA
jgi:nucleotide-binding universal stress UspA family protein